MNKLLNDRFSGSPSNALLRRHKTVSNLMKPKKEIAFDENMELTLAGGIQEIVKTPSPKVTNVKRKLELKHRRSSTGDNKEDADFTEVRSIVIKRPSRNRIVRKQEGSEQWYRCPPASCLPVIQAMGLSEKHMDELKKTPIISLSLLEMEK